ncbi:MAG: methyl-accepting chemotaxis protein [Devosia sp.]
MKGLFGGWSNGRAESGAQAVVDAVSQSLAVIEFAMDGTILSANANFLTAMGYELAEIAGQHHRMFVTPDESAGDAYREFWDRLRAGHFQSAEYLRLGKGGREVWIQATYNPILGTDGKPTRVVKFATDITAQKLRGADFEGQLAAISKSQAVIEFAPTGEILTANDNFLATLGYRLDEIRGRHHEMFVPPDFARSTEYREFWARLGRGEYQAAEYLRLGKGGREVWIQASYNPILDHAGRVLKVVKYATDVTSRKQAVVTIGKSLAQLAEGDLRAQIDTPFEGEFDEVRCALNHTVESFADIVRQLRHTSGSLRTATSEILSGANDLAERTTRQAATIEETSAAMEQLSTTVADNARRAEAANAKSQAVLIAAAEGGEVMRSANAAMERISTSSSRISNIIGMIDDIAFQTNLLALNASVEAARAGDAGKGFAVVAVEVRRLAQSAAGASSEVKALIEQSSTEVGSGSRLVSAAAEKLAAMLSAVEENGQLIGGIAGATQEQAAAIGQVTTAVRQIDEMTQHNAALVEEINASIEQTEGQASDLDGIVDRFVVGASRDTPIVPMPARSSSAAARRFLTDGNAAISTDWNEF